MRKAVFLDRDSTLIQDDGYFHDSEKVALLPGVIEGLRTLQSAGFLLIVVTNQSGIGRGYFPESDTIAVNKKIAELLGRHGIRIEKFYYCPHTPEANCICRKPKPFLVEQAADEFDVGIARSFFVGDHVTDVETGRAAGTVTVSLHAAEGPLHADVHAPNLEAAAKSIVTYAFKDHGNG